MMMMGMTISLAGKPKIKAIRIMPSSPMIRAKGSRNSAQKWRRLSPLTGIFAISQMTTPAGAATAAAQHKQGSVKNRADNDFDKLWLPIRG